MNELVEAGYANLTTANVAERAGVSRGAQQHHFPQKRTLVAEAVTYLAHRQLQELHETMEAVSTGRDRTERLLDIMYRLYSGPLFTAMLQLTLASRTDPELAELVEPVDREVARSFRMQAAELFGSEIADQPDFDLRIRHVFATIRGLALLRLHGRSQASDRQWRFTRGQLMATLGPH